MDVGGYTKGGCVKVRPPPTFLSFLTGMVLLSPPLGLRYSCLLPTCMCMCFRAEELHCTMLFSANRLLRLLMTCQ